jgi:hypothetical protein
MNPTYASFVLKLDMAETRQDIPDIPDSGGFPPFNR